MVVGLAAALTLAAALAFSYWPRPSAPSPPEVTPSSTLSPSPAQPLPSPSPSPVTLLAKPPIPTLDWKALDRASALARNDQDTIDAQHAKGTSWYRLGKDLERDQYDFSGAAYCYAKTAGTADEPDAFVRWGALLLDNRLPIERAEAGPLGFLLTRYAAIRNAKKAQDELAKIYWYGMERRFAKRNPSLAAAWALLAADPKHESSREELEQQYETEIPRDKDTAWVWIANGGQPKRSSSRNR